MSSSTHDASTIAPVHVACWEEYLQKVVEGNKKLLNEQREFSRTTLCEQQKINKVFVESILNMGNELAAICTGRETEKRNEVEKN